MPEDQDLDTLIDAALATYADPSADAKLAERILCRFAGKPKPQPRMNWLPWTAAAFSAAACLLLLVFSGRPIAKPHPAQTVQSAMLIDPNGSADRARLHADRLPLFAPQQAGPLQSAPLQAAPPINRAVSRPHIFAAAAAPRTLPKLDVFPTPTPLTRQERALADYVARTPWAEQQALAQSEHQDAPLTVASIRVMQSDRDADAITIAR